MKEYIATFYTHAGAIVGKRELARQGIDARMMPVPRALSSSCGTCVCYQADAPHEELLTKDLEAVYEADGGAYVKLAERR